MVPHFGVQEWLIAIVAATGVGISKSGLPGISLLHVVLLAQLFPGLTSTGVVLPMLICGDIGAVLLFRRHAQWNHVLRTLPPALVGITIGWWLMGRLDQINFRPIIGGIVLALALLQLWRHWRPGIFSHIPHTRAFAWTIGLTAGVTTMLANAAGPVMGLYLLAVGLPKAEFIGTSAWFFLLVNLLKLPFSAQLGLITPATLAFNVTLAPAIIMGLFLGKRIITTLPQRWFDTLILAFAIIAAMKLLGLF